MAVLIGMLKARKRQKADGTAKETFKFKQTFKHYRSDPKSHAFISFFGHEALSFLESPGNQGCFEDVIQGELASHIEARDRHLESTAEFDCAVNISLLGSPPRQHAN